MKSAMFLPFALLLMSLDLAAIETELDQSASIPESQSSAIQVEKIWAEYLHSKGGATWGESTDYPPYQSVKEGDTIIIQLEQGHCLMEFFHSRWRRANDVRRWGVSVNAYSACPYVFD